MPVYSAIFSDSSYAVSACIQVTVDVIVTPGNTENGIGSTTLSMKAILLQLSRNNVLTNKVSAIEQFR